MSIKFEYGASRIRARVGSTFDVSVDGDTYAPIIRRGDINYPEPDGVVRVGSLGILPTNTGAENLAAFDAAMADLPLDDDSRPVGQKWLFDGVDYSFSGTLHIIRSMILEGVTTSRFAATRFFFPGDEPGIVVHYTDQGGGADGSGSLIKHIIVAAEGSTPLMDGVWVKGYGVWLYDINCYGWGRNGIRINASVGEVPPTNGNGWRLDNCATMFNGSHGLFVQGGDSNAGVCTLHLSGSNGGYGIYEDSFLGNTYVGPQTLSNTSGGYWAQGASQRNVFINPYGEGDEPASLINSPNVVVGSLISPGITGNCATLYGGSANNPMLFTATSAGQTQIGSLDGSKSFLQFYPTVDVLPVKFKFGQTTNPFGGCYEWNYADLSGGSRFALAGENAKLTGTFHCAIDPTTPIAWDGMFLGRVRVFSGAATPTTGTNNRGDRMYYTEPSAGGFEGEVCVESGTAGTYVEGLTATTDGTSTVELSATSSVLKVGECVTINATDVRLATISGTAVTVEDLDGTSTTIPAAATQAIAYKAPVWKTFGAISA